MGGRGSVWRSEGDERESSGMSEVTKTEYKHDKFVREHITKILNFKD